MLLLTMMSRLTNLGWLVFALVAGACAGSGSSDGGSGGANTGGASTGGTHTGGTSTGGVNTGGFGAMAGGSGNKFPCLNPKPVVLSGQDTGFDVCAKETLRRREAKTCPDLRPNPTPCSGATTKCTIDADCKAKPNDYCQYSKFGGPGSSSICQCATGCTKDSECPSGQVCLCGSPIGKCIPADCGTSADCDPGFDCITSVDDCAWAQLHCQTPADECLTSDDCGAQQYCGVGTQGNLVCKTSGCAGA